MNKAWKSLSLLLSFILILGCVLAHPMQARAEEGDISFTLRLSCANGVTPPQHYEVAYELLDNNGEGVDLGYGSRISKSGSANDREISLDCTVSASTVADKNIASVRISVTNAGYDIYYNGNVNNDWADGKIIPISNIAGSDYAFQLKNSQGGSGPNPPQGPQEDVDLTVNWSGAFGEIKVGGRSVDLSNASQHFTQLNVNEDKIDVSIQAEPTIEFSFIKVNGTEQLAAGEKTEFYSFQIPKTDRQLSIVVETAQSSTYTIQWAYDDTFGEDAKVEHGKVEMISGYKTGDDTYWHVESGSTVRVKLVPEYGYQVVGAKINGDVDLVAENESNVFTFEMPSAHVHFKGIFNKTDDIVANSSAAVSGASFSGSAVASTGGTAKMTISEAAPSDTDNVSGTIDTTKSVQAVDIKMDQLFYKNSADDVWSTNKTELSSAAEVSLTVNQSAGGYAVLREHDGVVEEIDANYNSSTNTITFSSNKYSTYTLVPLKGQETTIVQQEETRKNEDSKKEDSTVEDTVSYIPQPIGDVVGGTSITSWNDLDKVLDTKKISTTKTTHANNAAVTNSPKTELVQLKLRNNNTTVPASTFAKLSNTNYSGMHLFTGNGTAVTFVNDAKLAGQKAINVGCSTVSLSGRKVITFKSFTKLSSTVVLHATVPAGTKTVSVYFTGADKKRTLITTVAPTAAGRLCFAINQLGKYELVYN